MWWKKKGKKEIDIYSGDDFFILRLLRLMAVVVNYIIFKCHSKICEKILFGL